MAAGVARFHEPYDRTCDDGDDDGETSTHGALPCWPRASADGVPRRRSLPFAGKRARTSTFLTTSDIPAPRGCAGGAACSSKGAEDGAESGGKAAPTEQPARAEVPGAPGTPGAPAETPAELSKNPIEGIGPAKLTLDTRAATDGAIWSVKEGVLFFTTPLGEGGLYRMGAPIAVASGYENGDAGVSEFDTLKSAVVGASGTIYATDPLSRCGQRARWETQLPPGSAIPRRASSSFAYWRNLLSVGCSQAPFAETMVTHFTR
jgi:hypothetical protein